MHIHAVNVVFTKYIVSTFAVYVLYCTCRFMTEKTHNSMLINAIDARVRYWKHVLLEYACTCIIQGLCMYGSLTRISCRKKHIKTAEASTLRHHHVSEVIIMTHPMKYVSSHGVLKGMYMYSYVNEYSKT